MVMVLGKEGRLYDARFRGSSQFAGDKTVTFVGVATVTG